MNRMSTEDLITELKRVSRGTKSVITVEDMKCYARANNIQLKSKADKRALARALLRALGVSARSPVVSPQRSPRSLYRSPGGNSPDLLASRMRSRTPPERKFTLVGGPPFTNRPFID